MRYLLVAVVVMLSTPLSAQTTLEKSECTKANIESTFETIVKMKESRQKETATSEIAAAKNMLAQNNIEACKTHLLKAELQTK